MSDMRCHWWDAERGKWFALNPHKMLRMKFSEVKPGDPCPYCGAALPEAGPEEDGDE